MTNTDQYFTILEFLSPDNQALINANELIYEPIDTDYVLSNMVFDQLHLSRIIANYPMFQTQEALDKLMSLSKHYGAISHLISVCQYCQTEQMIEYYRSCSPVAFNVGWLIANCEYCQTEQMIEYWKSLRPSSIDIKWLIVNSSYCQTIPMLEYFKNGNPTTENIVSLLELCEYCQSTAHRQFLTGVIGETVDPTTTAVHRDILEDVYECLTKYTGDKTTTIPADTDDLLDECMTLFKKNASSELTEYFRINGPDPEDISWLISSDKTYMTEDLVKFYLSLRPSIEDIDQLLSDCGHHEVFANISNNLGFENCVGKVQS